MLPEALGHSSEQREPPETCTEGSYGVCEPEREREAFARKPTALRPRLSAIPLPSSSPSFYRQGRSRFPFTPYLPNLPRISYVQLKAHVHEESVSTLRYTDSACGRFSSRHRDGILVQSTPLPEPPLVAKLPTGSPQVRQQEWGLARQGGKPFTEPPSARVHHNVRIHTHM